MACTAADASGFALCIAVAAAAASFDACISVRWQSKYSKSTLRL